MIGKAAVDWINWRLKEVKDIGTIAVPYFANLHLAVMRILLLQDKTQMGVNYYDHQMAISLKWYSNHSMVSIREGRRGNNFQLR